MNYYKGLPDKSDLSLISPWTLKMKNICCFIFLVISLKLNLNSQPPSVFTQGTSNSLRAPAYPLVTIDPYISIWSFTDKLYEDTPRHWTKTKRPLTGAIRVDGKVYRFMGIEEVQNIPVIYTGDIENWDGRYTNEEPPEGWEKLTFNDAGWKEGKAPYTLRAVPPATNWNRRDIWVRRELILDQNFSADDLMLEFSYDDFAEIFINGIQ